MSDIKLTPYLFFQGNAGEAMDYYQSIFGGSVDKMKYSDIPGQKEDEMSDKLIHCFLHDGAFEIMASDVRNEASGSGQIELSLSGSDEILREYFEKLAEGGEVRTALKTEFWGDTFGNLTDKYGIRWMISIAPKKES